MRNLDETHKAEMKRQKEVWAAAEKIRRDEWITQRAKKIKEMTVKGLEPQIQGSVSSVPIQVTAFL